MGHLGWAVRDLQAARAFFLTLGLPVDRSGPDTAVFAADEAAVRCSPCTISLKAPSGPGPFAQFLEKRGPGLHHLMLRVQDIGGTARADEAGDDAFDNWTQDDRKLDTTVRKVNRNPLGDGHLGCGMCCGMSEPLSRTSRTARGCGSMERRRWRQPRISGAPINAGALRRAPSGRHPCPSGVRTA